MEKGYTDRRIYSLLVYPFSVILKFKLWKEVFIMNKELNNAIENNEKVYAENKKATDKNIKSIDDVIAAMNEINEKYDAPITNIKTIDDIKKCMSEIKNQH